MSIDLFILGFGFIVFLNPINAYSSKLIQRFNDRIGAGNYTYYHLNDQGNYKIQLISESGDADLYVSTKYRYVTFNNYEFESTTYGYDEIHLSNTLKRPITIAVYGHPFYKMSSYLLNIYLIHDSDTYEEYAKRFNNYNELSDLFNKMPSKHDDHHPKETSSTTYNPKNDQTINIDDDDEADDGSILKTIAIGILKLIAEILLN